MPVVDLVYFQGCPNVGAARTQLARAFALVGAPGTWSEWRVDAAAAPAHLHGYGSPTVLVDGRDVAGVAPLEGTTSCRLYASEGDEPRGAPPVETIVAALRAALEGESKVGKR